jgi:hypothetical protein
LGLESTKYLSVKKSIKNQLVVLTVKAAYVV